MSISKPQKFDIIAEKGHYLSFLGGEVRIKKLHVRIGARWVATINDCSDEDPDVAVLLRSATSISVIVMAVKPNDELAAVIERLTRSPDQTPDPDGVVADDSSIEGLACRIDSLDISIRLDDASRKAGLVYVWQLAEKSERELFRRKFRRKRINEIKELLSEIGLSLGMNLDKVREFLPTPEPPP